MGVARNKKTLLFDFDGVIVDTFEDCFEISNQLSQKPITRDEYRRFMDGNIYEHEDIKGRLQDGPIQDDPFAIAYVPRLMALNPVPGMVDVLKKLGETHTLVVVSSTVTSPIEEYLRTHDIFELFDKVYGADIHLSKVVKTHMVFEEFGVTADDCLFITDTLGDMHEAAKAGVESIGVSWGFHKHETFEKGNPVAIVDSPEELLQAIQKL